MRYELVPGGCTGCQNKLWLESDPPKSGEFEHRVGGVSFVLLESQRHLVQGARIDFGAKDGQSGFIVTAPHASQKTKDALSKWIMDEFRKRNPDVGQPTEEK